MKRRQLMGRFVVAALVTAGAPVHAQNFPTKPLRIIVPYAAGGSPDTVARILAPQLGAVLGHPVVVENIFAIVWGVISTSINISMLRQTVKRSEIVQTDTIPYGLDNIGKSE